MNLNILVKYSFFINFISETNGGAIKESTKEKVSVTSSVFEKCQSSESGGGIFVEGDEMEFNNLCFYSCISKESPAIKTQKISSISNSKTSTVYISENSLTANSQLNSSPHDIGCSILTTKQSSIMKQMNITNSIINHIAGVCCEESQTCEHSYFNLVENQATEHGVLIQYTSEETTSLSYINSISNQCPDDFPLVRNVQGPSFTVTSSNFISNTCHQQIFSSDINVISCYLQNNNAVSGANNQDASSNSIEITINNPACYDLNIQNGFSFSLGNLCMFNSNKYKISNKYFILTIYICLLYTFK